MATKIEIMADEVWPVYFIEQSGFTDDEVTTVVEEVELADMLAIQENFWKLQKKLQDLYRTSNDN